MFDLPHCSRHFGSCLLRTPRPAIVWLDGVFRLARSPWVILGRDPGAVFGISLGARAEGGACGGAGRLGFGSRRGLATR